MDESWEYHAKQNKSNGKSQEPYDFTHIRDGKPKAINEQMVINTDHSMVVTRGKMCGEEGAKGPGGQCVVTKEGDEHTMQYTDDVL